MPDDTIRDALHHLFRPVTAGMLIAAFVMLSAGCAGSGEPEDTSMADTTADAETMRSDTTRANATHTDTMTDDTVRADSGSGDESRIGADLTPHQPPPPGTLEVRAVIEACTSGTNGMECEIDVQEVLRSGMSTPVMGPGRRTVRVQRHIADAHADGSLQRETPRDVRLAAPTDSPGAASDSSMWTLVRIL